MKMSVVLVVGAFVAGMAAGGTASSGAMSVLGAADEDTRRAVADVKNAIVEGHRTKNATALDKLYADDYVAIDSKNGRRTKSQLLGGLEKDPEIVSARYEIIAARRWGNIAVGSGHGHLVYRNADGSTRVADYYSFNVFEHRDGRWVYAAAFLP